MPDEKQEHPEEDLRHLLGYLAAVREAMRMQNWNVILHKTVHDDDDTHAYTWQSQNHFTVNIELGKDFFGESGETIRSILVHELIHAQHQEISEIWQGCIMENDDVPKSQAKSWDGDFRRQMERFVSWITRMIEGDLPAYDPKAKYEAGQGIDLHGEHGA